MRPPGDRRLEPAPRAERSSSAELDRLRRAAEQAQRLRDEVLSIVSHDLRNPLGSILISARVLEDDDLSVEDRKSAVGIIVRSTERIGRLLEDVLDVARLEAGRPLAIHPSAVDTTELVAAACATASDPAAARQVAVDCAAEPRLPEIWADRRRALQALGNVLDNAVRFAPAGGRVRFAAARAGESVRFSVTDSGPGMDAETARGVFRRFDPARGAPRSGAGLGLPLAKGIVEAHGGRIEIESSPGRGTTVHLTLPLADSCEDR